METEQEPRATRKKIKVKGQVQLLTREQFEAQALEMRIALIQQLIPLGLMAAGEELQREVKELAGARYGHQGSEGQRYGWNPGTVKLLGQRFPVRVPRVRGPEGEIQLRSYELLHGGVAVEEPVLQRVLYGISCRNYETSAGKRSGSIGTSKSTVSRDFVLASNKELQAFTERSLSDLDVVAVFLDGKSFCGEVMVIALGVTLEGKKRVLGFVESDTENSVVLEQFLRSLLSRGLNLFRGLLTILDGGKGLYSAVRSVFGKHSLVQRCQWHKRENVVAYLSALEQQWMRKRLQRAYDRPTHKEATKALGKIRQELEERNQSALGSLDEGFEETLTLHRLGVFAQVGQSFKTTNCLESVNSMVERHCGKVDHWTNSRQKHRWLATALRDIEPRMHRVPGYKNLPLLRQALCKELNLSPGDSR